MFWMLFYKMQSSLVDRILHIYGVVVIYNVLYAFNTFRFLSPFICGNTRTPFPYR